MNMRNLINRLSFCLCIASFAMLVIGIIIEITMKALLFESYLSGFFAYGIIFAIVTHYTGPKGN